ncbi:hypothetical protein A11A3_04164 [Alcanivorax hongdengensis A-11-3]|uniref:DUF2057 domain-containing protein n=1 Tax=Alcanivorax hongdengensis A-11-3 TaxID=1177179 RepID=L0WFA3_9GAMM|nr:DUF2057 domain-containing protein [Alcanivorax hongdengensis]EKF75523.1 hypothetical protein A11A3_04164 [Alcanivorax hongdengensis A-11-3]
MPLMRPLILFLCALTLAACARSPVVKLYDGPDKADSQLLTVRVPTELEVFTINGKQVDGANTFFATGHKDLKLAPGRYEILAYYKELFQLDADNHEIIKTNPANFIVDGKAGETYQLGFKKPQDVDEARAMEDNFSGWTENLATGDKVAAEKSGLILKRGFLAPITGEAVETADTATSSSVAPQAAAAAATGGAAASQSAPAAGSYLDTLKAQWNQATPEERRQFLQWISQ